MFHPLKSVNKVIILVCSTVAACMGIVPAENNIARSGSQMQLFRHYMCTCIKYNKTNEPKEM